MGRCGWSKKIALLWVLLVASCGGTGGGPSDSGKQFVFLARAQLFLLASVAVNNPTVLNLAATLLDPQGNPFRNTQITFEAEFADATFIPQDRNPATCNPVTCSNRGAVLTNDLGEARVTLIAGLTTGRMRIIVEAPSSFNVASGISVDITNQGFVSRGVLGIIPAAVFFVNPFLDPGGTPKPPVSTTLSAVGGTPPYRWNNSNKNLGIITPRGLPNINEMADYALSPTGPIPTSQSTVLQDTVTLLDTEASRATATITAIFAQCDLITSPRGPIAISQARGGEKVEIRITNGVGPFTVTQSIPESGTVVIDQSTGIITFTVATPPVSFGTNLANTLLIRDSRGCVVTVDLTITPATGIITVTANPSVLTTTTAVTAQTSAITAALFDSKNRPVAGVLIRFSTTAGTLSPLTATTDANGVTPVVTLTIPAGTAAGTVTVTALAPGNASGTATVTLK